MGRAVALACILLAGCSGETSPQRRADRPVFIVSIDSVRADRLPVYGYSSGRTPALDAFRRDAILYSWAFANAPLTLPSHASILTGELPPVHGIRGDIGYNLSADAGTIATTLRHMGYATGAAVSSYVLRRETGIGEGFGFYDDLVGPASRPTFAERDGDATRVALTAWLGATAGRRLFGFLHINEPHPPHEAPPGFGQTSDEYDNEITYADAVFGRFVETLKTRGLYDEAVIVVLSDHGEGLGDHGEDEHGLFVYRESLHVPLLIKLPRQERAGQTESRAAGLNHLRDLILDVVRGERKSPLLSRNSPAEPIYSETYYPRVHFGWRELRSLITDTRHFIDGKEPELYDYRADPAEVRNLAAAEPDAVKSMTQIVRMTDTGFRPPTDTAGDYAPRIASLRTAGQTAVAARPDPREKVQVVRDLQRAIRFYEAKRYRDAVPLLERVVFYEPAIVEGWAMLGRSRAGAGWRSLALEAYREGLKRFPGNAELALLAAHEYASAGNWTAATKHAESIAAQDPVLAHEALAQFASARGDLAAAREHAETVVRYAPGRVSTLLLLADISRRESRPVDQLMWLDRVIEEVASRGEAPREGIEAGRGQALAALGRARDAEAAYRSEVARYPLNASAWKELLRLLLSAGRGEEGRELLLAAVRARDTSAMRATAREVFAATGDRTGLDRLESTPAPR